MASLKRITLLALVMVALIIPVIAISENTSGASELRNESVWVTDGFNDRSNGTIIVRVFNVIEGEEITVEISNIFGGLFSSATRTATADDEDRGYMDFGLSFRIGDPGKYYASIVIIGNHVGSFNEINTFSFEVGRSIWSSVWTYVAIVVVIIIIGIVLFIRMRAQPKVDSAGEFTAMEEERKVKKGSGAKKETYKDRSKK
jgi:arginine exporter protein ArgO